MLRRSTTHRFNLQFKVDNLVCTYTYVQSLTQYANVP